MWIVSARRWQRRRLTRLNVWAKWRVRKQVTASPNTRNSKIFSPQNFVGRDQRYSHCWRHSARRAKENLRDRLAHGLGRRAHTQHQSNVHSDVQNIDRGESTQRNCCCAPPHGGQLLRGDGAHHGRGWRARRDATRTHLVHEQSDLARHARVDEAQIHFAHSRHWWIDMVRAAHSVGKPAYGVGPAMCQCM